jgi:hypothetical protein
MIRGINLVHPATQHRDRASAGFQRGAVCDAVNATRQATDHGDAIARQIAGQLPGDLAPIGRRLAGPHERNSPFIRRRQLALDEQYGRGVGDLLQEQGISGTFPGEHLRPRRLDLAQDLFQVYLPPYLEQVS